MNQREPLTEKLLESVESSKFVSCKAILSGEFYSKKDSKTTEFERWPQILVKLNFGEFGNSKLSSFCTFDNIAISWVKNWGKIRKVDREYVSHWSLN